MDNEEKKEPKTLFDKIKKYCEEESEFDTKDVEEKSSIIFKRGGEKCGENEEVKLIKK